MSKPTGVSLKDYCKAVEVCIEESGYGHLRHYDSGGSVHSFEVFKDKNDDAPSVVWIVHFSHNKKKEMWSDDIKKIYQKTSVPKERFIEVLKKISGISRL